MLKKEAKPISMLRKVDQKKFHAKRGGQKIYFHAPERQLLIHCALLRVDLLFSRYENDIEAYKESARECVQAWKERVFHLPPTNDPHYPSFSPYQPQIHEPVRVTMLTEAKKLEVRPSLFSII